MSQVEQLEILQTLLTIEAQASQVINQFRNGATSVLGNIAQQADKIATAGFDTESLASIAARQNAMATAALAAIDQIRPQIAALITE